LSAFGAAARVAAGLLTFGAAAHTAAGLLLAFLAFLFLLAFLLPLGHPSSFRLVARAFPLGSARETLVTLRRSLATPTKEVVPAEPARPSNALFGMQNDVAL